MNIADYSTSQKLDIISEAATILYEDIREINEEINTLRAENARQSKELAEQSIKLLVLNEVVVERDALRAIIMNAKETVLNYSGFDGAHHKNWVLDQALRILTGDDYEANIAEYEAGEDGPNTYKWDKGIAP